MGKRPPALLIKIPENTLFLNHMSKNPTIVLPKLLLGNSPLDSPSSVEEFEKELDRTRNEFNQFNKDLDEVAHSMKKLFEDAPELLASIEEIKRKQDNVEECIMATQEKIIENEHRLGKVQSLQKEVHEEINNDLKKIQEQIYEILEEHRCMRPSVTNLCHGQTRTTEQLDYMLQAIHEYARLIEEASLTIKHFGDVGSPIKYESLDLSPFRQYEGSTSYFDDHIYHSTRVITPEQRSPSTESQESPSASTSTTHTAVTTPTSLITDPELSPAEQQPPQIYPLPHYQLKHQKLLLSSMRRAAVGLKFLLYANQLNDYKNGFPESDCDLDLGSFDNPLTEEVVTTTYRDVVQDKEGNNANSKTNIASSSSDSRCDNSDSDGSDNEKNGNICVTIRQRSHVVHSYDLLRFEKRMVGQTTGLGQVTGLISNRQSPIARGRIGHYDRVGEKNTCNTS